jgi:hypothetical protein
MHIGMERHVFHHCCVILYNGTAWKSSEGLYLMQMVILWKLRLLQHFQVADYGDRSVELILSIVERRKSQNWFRNQTVTLI